MLHFRESRVVLVVLTSTASVGLYAIQLAVCPVRPGKANTEYVTANTHVTGVLVWTAFLKDHSYGKFHWPVSTSLTVLIPVLSMIRPQKMTMSWPASCSKICPRG